MKNRINWSHFDLILTFKDNIVFPIYHEKNNLSLIVFYLIMYMGFHLASDIQLFVVLYGQKPEDFIPPCDPPDCDCDCPTPDFD